MSLQHYPLDQAFLFCLLPFISLKMSMFFNEIHKSCDPSYSCSKDFSFFPIFVFFFHITKKRKKLLLILCTPQTIEQSEN